MLPRTKFTPPLPHRDVIPRGHLTGWLQNALPDCRLLLLCAPAGYGKTTLLATLPQALPGYALAWITLDADDNDPVRFLLGLGEALAAVDARLQRLIEEQVAASTGLVSGGAAVLPLRQIAVLLINTILDLAAPAFILAFDDLHEITNPAIYEALDYLLENLPASMHVAISTRFAPALRLDRLRARRQLAELNGPDLRFELDESQQFLNGLLQLGLSAADLDHIQQKTEGWPVGLVLLTNSLRGLLPREQRAAFLSTLDPVDTHTFHYLADEVLAGQPEPLRAFLLESAILSELTPSACREVTGRTDAGALLDALYHRNLFLTLIRKPAGLEEPVYRYHALFAEFLQRELERSQPERWRALHTRAAEVEKEPGQVIRHLLTAQAWAAACDAIEAIGEQYLQNGRHETVAAWLAALPEEYSQGRYRLLYLEGLTGLLKGDLEDAERSLERSLERLGPLGEDPIRGQVLMGLASLTFIRARFARCAELVAQAEPVIRGLQERINFLMLRASLALFCEADGLRAAQDLKAALRLVQRSADLRHWFLVSLYLAPEFIVLPGMLDLLEEFCKEARLRSDLEVSPLRLGVADTWAGILLRRGRLHEAIQMGKEAIRIKEQLGGYPFLGLNACLAVAAAYTGLGNFRAADEFLEQAGAQAPAAELNQALTGGGLYPLGHLRWLEGRFEEARQIYLEMAHLEQRLPLLDVLQKMLGGLLHISEKRFAAAETLLLDAVRLQAREGVSEIYGSARLLLAVTYFRWGKQPEALSQLGAALSACERSHTPGPVLQEMPLAAPLLRLAVKKGVHLRQSREYLEQMGLPLDDPAEQSTLLTARQMDILRLIAAGYSNQAIADELVLTLATVKSHAVHILNRLGASSRMEAVARARELGLL